MPSSGPLKTGIGLRRGALVGPIHGRYIIGVERAAAYGCIPTPRERRGRVAGEERTRKQDTDRAGPCQQCWITRLWTRAGVSCCNRSSWSRRASAYGPDDPSSFQIARRGEVSGGRPVVLEHGLTTRYRRSAVKCSAWSGWDASDHGKPSSGANLGALRYPPRW